MLRHPLRRSLVRIAADFNQIKGSEDYFVEPMVRVAIQEGANLVKSLLGKPP